MRPKARQPAAPSEFGEAYTRSLLRSDEMRIGAILTVLTATAIVLGLRSLLMPLAGLGLSLRGPAGVVLFAVMFELAVLTWILRSKRRPSTWFWTLTLLIECSLPTVSILLLWRSGAMPADRAITAPSLVFYGIFIVLSTLHLRPLLCGIAGLVCAAEHATVIALAWADIDRAALSTASLVTYPAALAFVGLASMFVAARLRQHLRAALTEARDRQRVEQELAVASRIQHGLLPVGPPPLADFEIAGWNQPADETGGDYYDMQRLPDGRVAISLADVSGHGIGPALIAAFCRAYVRATALGEHNLNAILTRVNSLIVDDLPEGRFVTLAVAILKPDSGHVEILSAGHGPILIFRGATTEVEQRIADGPPLGVVPDPAFDDPSMIGMSRGDVLVLITDGFFEWQNGAGEQFGIARLTECLARCADRGAASIIESLRASVEGFTAGQPQDDDLTAVVIKRL